MCKRGRTPPRDLEWCSPGEEKADLWGERPHLLGKLAAPLYRFAGSFPELLGARGGKLTQGGQAYRVLRAEEVTLGGRRLWSRPFWKGGKTMAETDLLEGLLELFQENVENVDFRRAYDLGWGTRLLARPVVCGQVAAQRLQDGRQETELVFWIFAPEESQREQVLSALWSLLREQCPGCGELTRETGRTDNLTRQRCAVLRALFSGEEGLSLQGREILLGGKAYRAAGVSVSLSLSGEELVSVGEEEPFALRDPGVQYQVELEGLQNASGLERMAVFTAQIGKARYTGCRWKRLELTAGKAVFLAANREEMEETP